MREKEEKHTVEQLEYSLTHDALTGLFARDGFYGEVRRILDENPDEQYLMVRTNIRDFKLVNELFGHEKGDAILVSIADVLKSGKILSDVTGRVHGDHFAFLIREENYSEKTLRACFRMLSDKVASTEYSLEFHVGVFRITDPKMEVSIMCDRANMAINASRDESSALITYYSDDLMEKILFEKEVISDFDHALQQRQFRIFLQPLVTADGKLIGAEALSRWIRGRDNAMQYPKDFIHVLESRGLIYRLDLFVWEEAARILRSWKGTPMEDISISVNISPRDSFYIDIERTFDDLVELYDISREKLHLEITETALMSNPEKYFELTTNLKRKGYVVAIDDFGSGYSSLNMLKDVDCDVLKIDMEFLRETENKLRSKIILESVIDMSKKLGMKVICEGVEASSQISFLTEMGCDMFQGYYFSEPIPVDAFVEKYSGRERS